ncbi:ABC transporter permease [Thermoflexus sp.]|uniref:ABC transporter permease n=1 Tax=Thermoflexus sp. TaxID=1969742 RepID=UPI0025F67280|nr:ABC transporter permease [Thermoflexus sp.]MDW8180334.1 ABC transporter permease [Anaerolineae bacterium]MCS6964421.1 ABC transporter permease [Thermoflexus sp.]MCS7350883.1 ABC transporter permease [Thermoflexus sp.]MCX7690573.1 ABC transporter permease [Thermoflexus sp.]MDW8185670.1 ABC transporter permease [Anaerolineae bacterium]
MRAIGWIGSLTLREAFRRRLVLAAFGLGAAFLALFGLALFLIHRELARFGPPDPRMREEIVGFFLLAGLYVANFLIVMAAVVGTADTIAGEIASGVIQAVAARPIARWQILLGKGLGHALWLLMYVLWLAGGVMGITALITGWIPRGWARGLALLGLEALIPLSLSLWAGTRFSTLATGALGLGLYGVAFIGGWAEQIGGLIGQSTVVDLGILASLLMPAEAIWRRAAYELQSPLARIMGPNPFTTTTVPSDRMVIYALAYILFLLLIAIRQFERRDL